MQPQATPISLLERLRRTGEPEAWARLAGLYTPLLYYWARRMGLQETDAADLVQDVFTILLQKLPDFDYDRDRSFRGWLRQITLNKWREKQRRLGIQREVGAGPLAELGDADPAASQWEAEFREQVMHRALEVMQGDFQESTWRACWEIVVSGRSAAEVAAELGLSVGAVRAAKFRVLARLRQEFDGLLD